MKTNLIFTCLILLNAFAKGQTDSVKNLKYRCDIELINPSGYIRGELFAVEDSLLTIRRSYVRNEDSILFTGTPGLYKIPVTRISEISVWKKGATARGFIYGAFAGAMAGALIGLASRNEPKPGESYTIMFSTGENVAMGASAGFLAGGLVGLAIGGVRFSIPIGGKKEKLELHRKEFQAYIDEK